MAVSKYLNYVKRDVSNKIDSLYQKENGCVSKEAPGSLVVAKQGTKWVVSFGWNYKDSMVFDEDDDSVLKDVVEILLENGYVFYHNEDMIVYVNDDERGRYQQYRKNMKVLDQVQAAKVLMWSDEKLEIERSRAKTMKI
jgi:hypothetical protein